MDIQTVVYVYDIVLFAAAVAAALMLVLIWRARHIAGSTPLLIKITGEILWMFFYALQLAGFLHPASEPYFWSKLTFLGVVLVPASFLVWTAVYTHHDKWITPRTIALLTIEPVVFNLIVWTDPWHGWFSGNFNITGQLGIAFWIHTLYSYGLLLISAVMQIVHFLRVTPAYRVQAFVVLMTLPISAVANVLTIVFMKQLKLDFSPLGFLAVGGIMVYIQLRHRLFDILPVARHKVMDEILDGVVVLDHEDRIIDINPAARNMLLDSPADAVHGCPAESVIPGWHELTANDSGRENQSTDFITASGKSRYINMTISGMLGKHKQQAGKLILLRDITEIKNVETALWNANHELLRIIEENEALQAQLKDQAIRDPLTGLYNRRFLEETLSRELEQARRSKEPMSLAIIDLDRFKQINDTFGHEIGDLFLTALADLLRTRTRKNDVACRYGGEEFVVVMPGATLADAACRINELREAFCGVRIHTGNGDSSVTFSAGLAAWPFHGMDEKAIIARADRALYDAKQAGRNRLVVASTRTDGTGLPMEQYVT